MRLLGAHTGSFDTSGYRYFLISEEEIKIPREELMNTELVYILSCLSM
jgi:hypothetical protein